ncbi:MAG: NAD(P)-binding protein [Luteitalea sp.]|nr:NAD(P)-binding protein [Luteitalea sp.]
MATDFDAAIVGSGFGGAVAACRLAEAGYRVVMLERGRRWHRQDYPSISRKNWIWNELDPVRDHGWLDIRHFGTIATIAGAGVGGGSLHFANVVIDAQPDLFDEGWPSEITFAGLAPYYQKVSDVLEPRKIPSNQFSNRTKLLKEAATNAGFGAQYDEVELAVTFNDDYAYDASREPRAGDSIERPNADGVQQGFCVHLGQCDLGCPVDARNTVAVNYIPRAERHQADVRPLHVVRSVEGLGDGYRIHFDRIDNGGLRPGSLTARIVVAAAGSIGSTELLLRCRDQHRTLRHISSTLGTRWSSNGNYLSPAVHRGRKVYPGRGPTITAGIRFFGANTHNGQHVMIEDGGVPDLLDEYRDELSNPRGDANRFGGLLRALYRVLEREPVEELMPWFAQGRDIPSGTFRLQRRFLGLLGRDVLRLSWDPSNARQVLDAIHELHRTLAGTTGGRILLQPPDAPITPHPLGGCPMAESATDGVVDHRGEVFGHHNLYVADGSILPRPVGHNPSKTIAALSERIADIIVHEGK